ncbi:hypothetical protein O181_017953 [Austropuccinia psidii MF-1]|uniref:Uncharacterized protein n=1 Tax=Austropuccinia psidii MF-1 TaxID=1389203 RepID=A0A9Q3GS89_9BASI|nr:hypothetical protein [Austropuccinia psidii MF-1]
MVHTRNGRNYSVQPDGSGQGRGKTRARSRKSSSRNTCLEDARVSPNYPRSVPTNVDVNSEPELAQGNILRVEPFPSGSHRDISVPVQKLIQSSKGRGVGNMPKPLEGGNELLITHQEISGSGEDHRTLRRLEHILLQSQEDGVGNHLSFVERRPIGIYRLQEFSKTSPNDFRTSKGPKDHQGKGKGRGNWHRPYPQAYRIPKLEPSAVDSVFNMARTLREFTAKEQEMMNSTFPHK